MGVIEDFVAEYERQFDYWESTAQTARRLLEAELAGAGLRAYVTSRAKSIDRLTAKLEQRSRMRTQAYANVAEIEDDIADRAGVRIALYFPGQIEEADKLLHDVLDVQHVRQFPVATDLGVGEGSQNAAGAQPSKRFSGYGARHFRARIPEASLSSDQARYAKATIEVQVASVLMHAWSEVEHDLVYKPLEGHLSASEHALLDQLNGLVLAGEIALEQLQKAGDARVNAATVPFRDHYELGEFLRSRLAALGQELTDATLGRVDILFRYLSKEGSATVGAVLPYLERLEQDFEQRPVSEQLADLILSGNETSYASFRNVVSATRHTSSRAHAVDSLTDGNSDAANQSYAQFVRAWARLEETLSQIFPDTPHYGVVRQLQAARDAQFIDSEQLTALKLLRKLRNDVVHSHSVIIPIKRLDAATEQLSAITTQIQKRREG